MTDTAHPSPATKDPTKPRGEALAPKPKEEKKPEKKIETPIMVALISAMVTLITSLIGSPLVSNLVNKPAATAPPPTAELVLSNNTRLSEDLIGGKLPRVTSIPAESAAAILEYTSTPQEAVPTSTNAPILPTATSILQPTTPPDTPTLAASSFFRCIAVETWFPYPDALNPEIQAGCWDLAEWGFSTDQGGLLLVYTPDLDQVRGIYMPISGDVDIHFTIQLNEFRTRKNKIGLLNFGIVQNDPLSIYTGGFLSYEQPEPGQASPVRVLVSGSNQATQRVLVLEDGFQHEVVLSVQDDLLTVYLNGEPTGKPVRVPPGDRAFWIGYVLPSLTELDVAITDFSIQPK